MNNNNNKDILIGLVIRPSEKLFKCKPLCNIYLLKFNVLLIKDNAKQTVTVNKNVKE